MNAWDPPRITTERLLIRPLKVDDLQAVHRFTMAYAAEQYGSWLGGTDAGSIARYMSDTIARYGRPPRCDLGITLSNRLIGGLAFRRVWIAPPALEIGWVLHPDASGQGLATEALSGLVQYLQAAFNDVARFEARIRASDSGAAAILSRVGFDAEGTLCGGFDADGLAVNLSMFRLIRGDSTS